MIRDSPQCINGLTSDTWLRQCAELRPLATTRGQQNLRPDHEPLHSRRIGAHPGTTGHENLCPKRCTKMLTPLGCFFYCVIRKLSLKYFNVAQVINTSYPTSSIYYIHQKPSGNFSKTSCETTAINQNFGERFILSV